MKLATALLAAIGGLSHPAIAQTADTIYHNGSILTIDDANPRAEAVAVKDGKILAVGKEDEVLKTKGSIETGKLADFVILDQDPTAIDPEALDAIKVTQTIKEGATVFLAAGKEEAHLSRPDERGEHAFSNFIRQLAAADEHDGHVHAPTHCCGCRIAALLGDALASSSGQ